MGLTAEDPFWGTFAVVIQLGAILAVVSSISAGCGTS